MTPPPSSRRQSLLILLTALFAGFYVAADLIGNKLFSFTLFGLAPRHLGLEGEAFVATAGILAFPLTFLLTDVINEYFGRRTVRGMTFAAVATLLLLQPVVLGTVASSTVSFTPGVTSEQMDGAVRLVLGPAWAIIAASVSAFLVGQLLDVMVFSWIRRRTGGRWLWLRAQGSTLVSQLIDTLVVIGLAFVVIPALVNGPAGASGNLPQMPAGVAFKVSVTNYLVKFAIAIAVTPLLYLLHWAVHAWLGHGEAEQAVAEAHPDGG